MSYPKPIMTIRELVELGYSEKALRDIFYSVGYPVAFKEVNTKTSPIKFNTEQLEKHLRRINERGRV